MTLTGKGRAARRKRMENMASFKIERTEMVTRTFEIEAADEDEALDLYQKEGKMVSEVHSGDPDVRVVETEEV